jgi:hypothetical protein
MKVEMQKTRLSLDIPTSILMIIFLVQPIAQVIVVEANPFMFGPEWKISLPEQSNSKTYQTSTVPIEVQIYTPTDYSKIIRIYYILDLNYSSNNNPQKTLTVSNPQSITYYAKPSILYSATGNSDNLSNGNHTIDAYAANAKGETLKSYTRNFQVNAISNYPTPTVTPYLPPNDRNAPHLDPTFYLLPISITVALVVLAVVVYRRRKKVSDSYD